MIVHDFLAIVRFPHVISCLSALVTNMVFIKIVGVGGGWWRGNAKG